MTITVLTLSPGVDSLLVIRNSSRGGWRDGVLTSVGVCTGLFFHAAISAAGLSVILLSSAELFLALKLAGAAYLVWLGVQGLRAAWRSRRVEIPRVTGQSLCVSRSLREGLLSNLLNPKPIVFYMAFLPQFVDPAYSALLQSLAMAAVHFLIGMLWLALLAAGVQRAKQWLARPAVSGGIDGVTGLLLIAIGVRLGTS
nr:LysE family translocator [Motiliproteus sediminis]